VRALAAQDLDTMRDAVFFDGDAAGRKLSRFWILLVLSSVIAAAGVVGDSTATVIGAMIVAPLMTPILGSMLAVVTGDKANLLRSVALVVAGAATAIGIGYLVGLMVVNEVVASTNSQVAGRVSPRLIDLIAALATGMVGSVALARRDIADTLPGVAIAISLVPPLSVVGLTLESGAADEAQGALILFITNVTAILATGTIVMGLYGAHRVLGDAKDVLATLNRRTALLVIVGMFVLVMFPLSATSLRIRYDTAEQSKIHDIAGDWADGVGWELVEVVRHANVWIVRFEGPTPIPDTAVLSTDLDAGGIDPDDVRAELLPRATVDLGTDADEG
jgi:uncharacterized hydrophobic protein (TIGR00271 family)